MYTHIDDEQDIDECDSPTRQHVDLTGADDTNNSPTVRKNRQRTGDGVVEARIAKTKETKNWYYDNRMTQGLVCTTKFMVKLSCQLSCWSVKDTTWGTSSPIITKALAESSDQSSCWAFLNTHS